MKYLISIVTTVVGTSYDGPGIPQDFQSLMFEQSLTTKDVGKGTGLGPNISYLIVVEMHNGDISFTSKPGDTNSEIRLTYQSTCTLEHLNQSY
jgi:signal transduction histidine kinase